MRWLSCPLEPQLSSDPQTPSIWMHGRQASGGPRPVQWPHLQPLRSRQSGGSWEIETLDPHFHARFSGRAHSGHQRRRGACAVPRPTFLILGCVRRTNSSSHTEMGHSSSASFCGWLLPVSGGAFWRPPHAPPCNTPASHAQGSRHSQGLEKLLRCLCTMQILQRHCPALGDGGIWTPSQGCLHRDRWGALWGGSAGTPGLILLTGEQRCVQAQGPRPQAGVTS